VKRKHGKHSKKNHEKHNKQQKVKAKRKRKAKIIKESTGKITISEKLTQIETQIEKTRKKAPETFKEK